MLTDAQRTALAARLRQNRRDTPPPDRGPLVALSSGTVPAFAVHAVGGSVHEYAPLAQALGGACAVSGIEAAGLRAGATPVAGLATMAERYAALIREAQPAGPHRLIGWSMGGVLAYETARRLEAAGDKVALVVLIDAPYRTVPSYADSEEGLAALFVADALRGTGSVPPASALRPVAEQLAELAARLVPDPAGRAAMAGELNRRYAVFAAHTAALAGYEPSGPLDAAGVLVAAHGSKDSAAYWTPLLRGGAQTVASAADHYGCLRPPAVAGIASAIRKVL
jgi:thioesterase domain-containing protein